MYTLVCILKDLNIIANYLRTGFRLFFVFTLNVTWHYINVVIQGY